MTCAACQASRDVRLAAAQLRIACEAGADLGARLRRTFRPQQATPEMLALVRAMPWGKP